MPTPASGLVTALRAGTVARVTLLDMAHSQGQVRLWNGIGELSFGGNTYSGVGGLARVGGLGEVRDLQNHEVTVLLSGVTMTALSSVDPSVRGNAATIYFVWLNEAGAVVDSRTMFAGFADNLVFLPDFETVTMLLTLRSPIANWADIPARTYTPRDQDRIFSGDTGFKFVPGLVNSSVSGWGPTTESSGGYVVGTPFKGGSTSSVIRDSITDELVGSGSLGAMLMARTGTAGPAGWTAGAVYGAWEETTHSSTFHDASHFVTVGGNKVTVDTSGFVQTAGGKFLEAVQAAVGLGTATRLRRATAIGALTGATATVVQHNAAGNIFRKTGSTQTDPRDIQSIIDNREGPVVQRNSGTGAVEMIDRTGATKTYVEDVTGAAVTATSGGNMQVGGSNCVMDSSGAVRSPGGRKIVIAASPTVNFLRVWT